MNNLTQHSSHDWISASLTPLRNVENYVSGMEPVKVPMELLVRGGESSFELETAPSVICACLDISPSMRGSKLEAAKTALKNAISLIKAGSQLSVIVFAGDARLLGTCHGDPQSAAHLTSLINNIQLGSATKIGKALELAFNHLQGLSGVKSVIVLSDGQTQDETKCRKQGEEYAQNELRLDFLGTDDVDVNLARFLTDRTGGRLEYMSKLDSAKLSAFLNEQMNASQCVIVQNVVATIKTFDGTRILTATKSYPDIVQAASTSPCILRLGNIMQNDYIGSYFELLVSSPIAGPQTRHSVSAGEIVLSYDVPQRNQYGLNLTIPIEIQFAAGVSIVQNANVLKTMQSIKLNEDMTKASSASTPDEALSHLANAQRRTQIIGDANKTQIVNSMAANIRKTRVVSDDIRKTAITTGRRTKIAS